MLKLSSDQIKDKLLTFLKEMENGLYNDPDTFEHMREEYDGEGSEYFDERITAAAEVLAACDYTDFQPVYANLYDQTPLKRGILISESIKRFGCGETARTLETARHSDYGHMIPDEVYTWAEEALYSRAFTNLLSFQLKLDPEEIDVEGHLSNFSFNYAEFTQLLITDDFEFLPVKGLEISVNLVADSTFFLERKISLSEGFCPYEMAEDLIDEIIGLKERAGVIQ